VLGTPTAVSMCMPSCHHHAIMHWASAAAHQYRWQGRPPFFLPLPFFLLVASKQANRNGRALTSIINTMLEPFLSPAGDEWAPIADTPYILVPVINSAVLTKIDT
jgi:hypothetical protein